MSGSSPLRKILRYGIAAIGPIGSAGAQFLLSLILLRSLDKHAFGSFSFLLVATQLSWGLWSALFCAPLPILFHAHEGMERQRLMQSLFSSNLLVALAAALLFGLIAFALGVPVGAAIIFGIYGCVALLRWFARAYAYASGKPLRTMVSDNVYAATLLLGLVPILLDPTHALSIAYATLLAGAVLGMIPFGADYLRDQFTRFSARAARDYAPVFRQHSGWSLVGVVTTEATANSHAYIVTALFGPGAFAPIAASALLIRPISVAMNALTEFERANMARALGRGSVDEARESVRHFRWAMIAAWAVTALAAAILLRVAPHAIFPRSYPLSFVASGAALWMLVAGVRLMRMPESTLLQAAGQFRPLALASVYSSGFSVMAVLALLLLAGTLWSIVGILIGEAIYAIWIWRQCRLWLKVKQTDMPPTTLESMVAQ